MPTLYFISTFLRNRLLLNQREASFDTRGFPKGQKANVERFELIGQIFMEGYNDAIQGERSSSQVLIPDRIAPIYQGFYSEGFAMGSAILDALPFSNKNHLEAWMNKGKTQYEYLNHIGAGWAIARVPWRRKQILSNLDPVLKWLAFDGLGFHDTYFYHQKILGGWKRNALQGYASRAYDQGIGRALWFVSCGDVVAAKQFISDFNHERHADLWSGLGLAMTYAGGKIPSNVHEYLGQEFVPNLAQGCAFALEARSKQGFIPDAAVEAGLTLIPDHSVGEIIKLVDTYRLQAQEYELDDQYEHWRVKLGRALANG